MMLNTIQQSLCTKRLVIFEYAKRFAGHSKWANIKHTKALKDGQRANDFNKLRRQMCVAITEGKSTNPTTNVKLAQIIEQAKKASMPAASIKNILAAASAPKSQGTSGTVEIRGPGGSIVLVQYHADNIHQFKSSLNTIMRKTGVTAADSGAKHVFQQQGVIEAKSHETIETATDHAIQINAEDVTEIDKGNGKLFQFTCPASSLFVVKRQLEALNYDVMSAEAHYNAHHRVNLSDTDLNTVSVLYEKLEALEEVVNLYDNIE